MIIYCHVHVSLPHCIWVLTYIAVVPANSMCMVNVYSYKTHAERPRHFKKPGR